jgi:hypothetical protein
MVEYRRLPRDTLIDFLGGIERDTLDGVWKHRAPHFGIQQNGNFRD